MQHYSPSTHHFQTDSWDTHTNTMFVLRLVKVNISTVADAGFSGGSTNPKGEGRQAIILDDFP